MSKSVNGLVSVLVWLMILLSGAAAVAEVEVAEEPAQEVSVYDLIDSTTAQVMEVVAGADAYVDEDPERYYAQIQTLLDPMIDYRGFARQVMGPYASSDRYRKLPEEARRELRGQLDRFTEVMRTSLVRTYSKGLLAFGEARIELDMPEDAAVSTSRVSVRQFIYSDRSTPYEVFYQMGRGKTQQWMLRNVIIESVNLGEIYRDQFLASAREHDGDLNTVIDSWTTVTVDVEN